MAEPISRPTLKATLVELHRQAQRQPEALAEQLEVEQPVLYNYLLELDQLPMGLELYEDVDFSADEYNHIFHIGAVLWQVLNRLRGPIPPLDIEDIDAAHAEMDALFEDEEEPLYPDISPLLRVEEHPEPELARFLIEAVSARPGDEDFQPVSEEHRPLVLVLFHIILKALLRGVDRRDPKWF